MRRAPAIDGQSPVTVTAEYSSRPFWLCRLPRGHLRVEWRWDAVKRIIEQERSISVWLHEPTKEPRLVHEHDLPREVKPLAVSFDEYNYNAAPAA